MPVTVLVGAQWGDEGKGRVADWLAREADVMARYAGGDNAGHTIQVGNQEFKLHLVPSGIVYPGVRCILGSGMVINPVKLVEELYMLRDQGLDIRPERVRISSRAHIITPGHLALDGAAERARGDESIGTTRRGIGPAYQDKAARSGILIGEMADRDAFTARVQHALAETNRRLATVYDLPIVDFSTAVDDLRAAADFLAPYITATTSLIHDALHRGKHLLCEGAQGTLLDLDHGHYPFVTSSSATTGGALTGLGFGPQHVTRVVGVTKAYCTRVGNGPFPTEIHGAAADQLRAQGHEYGTTTGRPRRCGWLDAVALRYAVQVNGLTEIVLTKLDVLSGFEELHIAVGYELDGQPLAGAPLPDFPLHADTAARLTPRYETMPGWREDISGARRFADLPPAAQAYVRRVEDLSGVPVSMTSVGPEREQAVILNDSGE